MLRRSALKLTAIMGITAMLPKSALGHVLELSSSSKGASVAVEIDGNHGHELVMSVSDAIHLLRATQNAPPVRIEIQGTSRHGHFFELSHEELKTLFIHGEVQKKSSKDLNHSHDISIRLELIEEVSPNA